MSNSSYSTSLVKNSILCLCLFLIIGSASAQTLIYDVIKGGKNIGTMTVDRHNKNGQWTYSVDSKVNVSVMITVRLSFLLESVFSGNQMISSSSKYIRDDKLKEASYVSWADNKYHINQDNERSVLENERINHCLSSIYFNEPTNVRRVFSERFAAFLDIKPTERHHYELTLPNGRKNIYTYENGICKEVMVDHMLATFYFKLRK